MESLLKKKKDIPTNQMDHKIRGDNEEQKTDPEECWSLRTDSFYMTTRKQTGPDLLNGRASVKSAEKKD